MAAKQAEKQPQYIASPINNPMVNYRVYYMSAVEKMLFFLLLFAAGGFTGWVFYGGLFKEEGSSTTATYISNAVVICIAGLAAAKVFFPAVVQALKTRRDKALRLQFRDMLETLTASLAAGDTVTDAFLHARTDLGNQYSEGDPIIAELNEIAGGLQNGCTLEQMLSSFSSRTENEDIQNFGNVIENCYRMGGDFKAAVRKTRDIISDKMAIEDEIQTKLASNKLQLNVMSLMPIALVAMLKMSSGSFADNLSSIIGVFAMTAALAIFVAAYFWGQKIIDVK